MTQLLLVCLGQGQHTGGYPAESRGAWGLGHHYESGGPELDLEDVQEEEDQQKIHLHSRLDGLGF